MSHNEIRAVAYVRMSSDQQAESPERQRADIKLLAEREQLNISAWYEDHGLTGTESLNRPEFQRLIRDAEQSKIDAVLVAEQSRFSRESVLDVMAYFREFHRAGVALYTAKRGKVSFDNIGDLVTTVVEVSQSNSESINLSARVTSGMRKTFLQMGRPHRGSAIFGYDKEFLDAAGKVFHRAAWYKRFKKPVGTTFRYVPSAVPGAVAAVQWMFSEFAKGEITLEAIARDLNGRGFVTSFGNLFTGSGVGSMLRNKCYVGIYTAGKNVITDPKRRGKFYQMFPDGEVHEKEGIIPALVSAADFELVQTQLDLRNPGRRSSSVFILAGLMKCIHCGQRMHGSTDKKDSDEHRNYRCRNKNCEKRFAIATHRVEKAVLDTIREHVLTEEGLEMMLAASEGDVEADEVTRLAEVEANIETISGNMALASSEAAFTSCERLLIKHQEEATQLRKLIANQKKATGEHEAIESLAELLPYRDHLEEADPYLLHIAIAETIDSITAGRKHVNKFSTRQEFHATCHFKIPGLGSIPVEADDLAYTHLWMQAALACEEEELTTAQIAKRLNAPLLSTRHALRRALKAGRVFRRRSRQNLIVWRSAYDAEGKLLEPPHEPEAYQLRWKVALECLSKEPKTTSEIAQVMGVDRETALRALKYARRYGAKRHKIRGNLVQWSI